jgi:hypothetical protein
LHECYKHINTTKPQSETFKTHPKPPKYQICSQINNVAVNIQIRGIWDISVVSEPSSCQPVKKRLSHDPMIPGIGAEYPEGRGHIEDEYIQYRRGHNRDRRDINKRDYIPFHIHSDTEPETEDHISSDTEVGSGGKMGDRHDIPEGKGKGPKAPYDSTQAMLNDLSRGQRI